MGLNQELSGIDFADYIAKVGLLESPEIHSVDYWREKVHARSRGDLNQSGDLLPWVSTHDKFRLRPGELTVWGGYNKHRKSMLLSHVMVNLSFKRKVAIASLEMKPESTILRMAHQSAGGTPSSREIDLFLDHGANKILIYDQLDMIAEEKILGFIHYCGAELGCNHVVVDGLTKMGFPEKDRTAEIRFINRLQYFAKHLNIHIHLIAHLKKPQGSGEDYIPNKFDVRGAGQITDLPDNIILVWANKLKEDAMRKREKGEMVSGKEKRAMDFPDQFIDIAGQREGEYEGKIALSFHKKSLQFLGGEGFPPTIYIQERVAA